MTDRTILRLSGADTRDFLQGLVTNDVKKLDQGLVYTALLTPQGKYIADFFLKADGDDVLLDADATQAPALMQRLSMYKLRADVTLAETGLHLHRGLSAQPDDALPDPRHPALGWRAYRDAPQTDDTTDWTALYVENLVPSAGRELHPDTFILEVGFERLNGVDFRKGCYVGQEVTARMKHKTELRKGLAQVHVDGPAEPGAEITTNGKPAGTLHSRAGDRALAYLRFDRASGDMQAADATVRRLD
ncbi:folate-binding protein YgfZ [Sulfitobacter pseudonitzschiae]|uniref:Folate-binding protein YgfZ n=1 Tax=Pseudosulfitobacter pseudonitzschiae TaxID=1402135 RepID=A0A9Q2RRK5_9RHOB|nr:folate-binding protein [Pseudosulfitobacter pseudonitzschiae]MBM2291426.1 folate-binding protein YgfZ [Pseudosulfitobacter pseudonitzschiae]MBM2296344.1 folate-binding protein YgfZ [Pseudosulfitobacter pseudonitzschiae]MBM2301257.1 folate-binding protein YgfZ [Pseudosulfitobacter pseudonitzschiae]MBM2311041.1 folate-binding protein YgfZ [Pseudosulfitobacter pseudonitzschiae]MBM2315954.1 folate-binding protein YgfZ [Pseudosulfitobacter pseudonitzschiae]